MIAGPFPPTDTAPMTLKAFTGAITPDGRRTLLVAMGLSPDKAVTMLQMIDIGTGQVAYEVELPWWAHGLDVTADGRTAVVAGRDRVAVVDLATARVIDQRDLPRADSPPKPDSAAISPDGRMVALARNESSSSRTWRRWPRWRPGRPGRPTA